MSIELETGAGGAGEARRPNVSGDLPSMLAARPMFRRSIVGYDRFQVDTYVQWAEDELATADREREHLIARQVRTQAALEETQQLLPHSSTAGEFLQVSRRIGSLLASAADEAESLRADAEADRAAASASTEQATRAAEQLRADAETEAGRVLAEAAAAATRTTDEAHRIAAEAAADAEQLRLAARAEAETRLARVQELEHRAAERADEVRRQAAAEGAAAVLQARAEVMRMLATGREQRRRADAAADADRARREQETLDRTAFLRAEVAALERRRTALRGEVRRLSAAAADRADARVQRPLPRVLDALHWRSRSLRAP